MSMPLKQTVSCPKCGAKITFTLWRTINTDVPNAIPDIISGKLFEAVCGKCGYKSLVEYPILFNDMIHDVMIFYTRQDKVKEAEKAAEAQMALFPADVRPARVRIVTDQGALREKTSIFNAGLDDRVVEILKLIVMAQLQDKLNGKKLGGVYFIPGEKPSFEIALEDGLRYVPVTMEMYNQLSQQYREQLGQNDGEYYINQRWAISFLSAPGNQLQ